MNLAIASLLVIATIPIHLVLKKRLSSPVATVFLTLVLSVLLFGPIFYFILKISFFLSHTDEASISQIINFAKNKLLEVPLFAKEYKKPIETFLGSIDLGSISQNILSFLGGAGLKSVNFIKDILFVLIFFFFVHIYGASVSRFLIEAVPYNNRLIKRSFLEVAGTMSVVSYSILSTAVLEGFLFGIMVYAFGYDFILFSILYGFASLIPVIGGFIMWFPIALYEASLGNYQNALIISLYTIVVISVVADTFVRPIIIEIINAKFNKSGTKIHSILIFFSIIAGITTFGFWGAILGPGVTALFIGVMNLLREENKDFSNTQDTKP